MSDKRKEFGQERSVCNCEDCRLNCEVMPGFLIPSDLDRIMPAGVEPLIWAETNLLASPGALVMRDGQTFRIPTLVPATKPDGTCIHLNEGLCGIHGVAPFGCAFFDCHSLPQDALSRNGMIEVYKAFFLEPTSLYRRIWAHLDTEGFKQHRAEVLRMKMAAMIELRQLKAAGWKKEDFVEALKDELQKGETE